MPYFGDGWGYGPSLNVAEKKRRAETQAAALAKTRQAPLAPVVIEGNKIATSAWGKAWCKNLESYAEILSRLERGRSYVRTGAVIDLRLEKGAIAASVSGTEVYEVRIRVAPIAKRDWTAIRKALAGRVASVLALLSGNLDEVMELLSRRDAGLFPNPRELVFECTCPDASGSWMCKHVAATLYGFGRRLDDDPELLFTFRHSDPADLVDSASSDLGNASTKGRGTRLDDADLSLLFGVEIAEKPAANRTRKRAPARRKTRRAKRRNPGR